MRVCTGCGISTDDDGNIIAAVSGTAPNPNTVPCGEGSGGKVYCSSADGKLYVDPPSLYREWYHTHTNIVGGKLLDDASGFGLKQSDIGSGEAHVISGDSFVVTNPSKCWPMQIWIENGVQHALFTVDSGGPTANDTAVGDIQIESHYTISGAFSSINNLGGHQHWGAEADGNGSDRRIYRFDSTGAFLQYNSDTDGTSFFTIPAGGSITISAAAHIFVIRHATTGNGAVKLENWNNATKVRGWAGP